MLHYGSPTPKKSYLFSNSRHVSQIYMGKLRGWSKKKRALKATGQSHELVTKYTDSQGKRRWKGNAQLKGSEWET